MTECEAKAQMLDNILACTATLVLSRRQAIAVVGGEKHLRDLIDSGKLTFEQTDGKGDTSKWKFNMSEVLKFAILREKETSYYLRKKYSPFQGLMQAKSILNS